MSDDDSDKYDLLCGHVNLLSGLVAMSKDVESLYASVKALSCVIKTSKTGGCGSVVLTGAHVKGCICL